MRLLRHLHAILRRFYPRLMQLALLLFLVAVVTLLMGRMRDIAWGDVVAAIGDYRVIVVLPATVFALSAHAVSACYDLIGRHQVGHGLSAARVIAINAVAYAFSLNLGALLGGWGFRMRLYVRQGLPVRSVMAVIALSVLTNWSGLVLIMGLTQLLWPLPLPYDWDLDARWLRLLGALLLLAVIGYYVLCRVTERTGRLLRIRGIGFRPPSSGVVLIQLVLSSTSWLLMSMALYVLLPDPPPFVYVVAALLASGVVGAALHVPGSIGVLEATLLVLLPGARDPAATLAAILAFRAFYYLVPLMIAILVFGGIEVEGRLKDKRRAAG